MYNFDELTNRKNENSTKWSVNDNELPMWIADMDFKTCPVILDAISKKLDTGVLGYYDISEKWYESIIDWYKKYHDFEMQQDELIFTTGVVASISSMVRRLTHPNENVIVLTPVYNIFFNSIINNGARVVESKMINNDDNTYSIDWLDLENKMKDPLTTLMIFCNPHNPCGNIWTKDEINRIASLAETNGVTIISDEVHCELLDPGLEYVPFAKASDIAKKVSISCISISKTFNAASVHGACVYCANKHVKERIERGFNNDEIAEPNFAAIDAMVAAFSYGREWLLELRQYLYTNKLYVKEYIEKELPMLKVTPSKATYLMWIDVSSICKDSSIFAEFLKENVGLIVSKGECYRGNGEKYIRLNIATQKKNVIDAMTRLKKAIDCLPSFSF